MQNLKKEIKDFKNRYKYMKSMSNYSEDVNDEYHRKEILRIHYQNL